MKKILSATAILGAPAAQQIGIVDDDGLPTRTDLYARRGRQR
ncbi:MAG: hypothetical protein V4693_04650 [Pseudomonadota bacterium]